MSVSATESEIFDSYEVKLFNVINLELLLIEKVLEFNSVKKNDEGLKNEILKEKISSIWSNLNTIIVTEKNETEKKFSQTELRNFNEALYIIVSFIDEFFIRREGFVSEYWNKNLFESLYFNSRKSGEQFFEKIDESLQSKNEQNKSLLFVYLLAISLGFKGRYYGLENENEILYYKRSLYSTIFNKSLYSFGADNYNYLSNINDFDDNIIIEGVGLTKNRKYYYFAFFLIFIYLIYTFMFFYYKKSHLE